jgi:hypothetical protein
MAIPLTFHFEKAPVYLPNAQPFIKISPAAAYPPPVQSTVIIVD